MSSDQQASTSISSALPYSSSLSPAQVAELSQRMAKTFRLMPYPSDAPDVAWETICHGLVLPALLNKLRLMGCSEDEFADPDCVSPELVGLIRGAWTSGDWSAVILHREPSPILIAWTFVHALCLFSQPLFRSRTHSGRLALSTHPVRGLCIQCRLIEYISSQHAFTILINHCRADMGSIIIDTSL